MTIPIEVIGPAPLDPAAEEHMVTMRDGVRLATDVYLPEGAGPVPAVLVRLPYDKCGRYTFMPQCAPFYTGRGYALVVQDVRGKFRSEGETMPFVHEVDDGYDTIEWVATRPWCNGVVGMFGDSYYGFTQWAAVASGHPALRAIVPRVTGTELDVLTASWRETLVPLYGADYLAHYWLDRNIYAFEGDYAHRPLAEIFDAGFAAVGARSAAFDLMVRSGEGGGLSPYKDAHPFDRLRIPVLHSVGWFDNIAPASFADYEALLRRPDLAPLQYLVADATDHENYHLRHVPIGPEDDHDQNDAALQRMLGEYLGPSLDFFDVFLKGEGDPASVPRAAWYLSHVGPRVAPTWPPPGARELRLYLGAAARATADAEGGALLPAPEPSASTARWVHDPNDLVPSTVTNPFVFLFEAPDERAVQSRLDVLTFTSAPFDEPLDLAGPVRATLVVDSSGPSMHVHAKLSDVAPDGSALMLVRGEALVRGAEMGGLVEVSLCHTGYRVRPGHRLRLHVASSDFPLYLPHPGTDEDPWQATEGRRNEQALTCGGDAGSCLRLTVLAGE